MSTANLKLVKRKPTVEEYRRLRSDSGLSGMSEEAAQKGLPKIMQALMDWLHENAPKTALVTLLADGEAYKLYEKYGFKLSAPASQGMLYRVK